jgi:hypothetical protein
MEASLIMAGRMPSSPKPIGWQLTKEVDTQAFYRGDIATDAPAPSSDLCRAIRDQIRARLHERVRDLDVEMNGNGIVISGRCDNFHTKQLAQHAALDVMNNEPLENRIQVLAH